MIKLVLTGIWVCVITLVSVYFSVKMATAPVPDADAAKKAELAYVKGESVTVPVIVNGAVNGYFVSRISYMMDKKKAEDKTLPVTALTTDELFSLLVGNTAIDIGNMSAFDPKSFRDMIKTDMNKRLNGDFVADVLIEQLDYLSREDLNATASGEPRKLRKPVSLVTPVADTPAAAPAH
ncbi:hypothetical protein [Oryzifoliimicrobium ureilyticus]|uniref:hypothetical protein n=1 Tax=Oryzifoliimicrobium ureilyticus TaxID=3113724 RepID=UPI0030768401